MFLPERTGAPAAPAAAPVLRDLPEWNLADFYSGLDAPELTADIARAQAQALEFSERWKGRLAAEAGSGENGRLGQAVQEFEALEELIGRIGSYACLV